MTFYELKGLLGCEKPIFHLTTGGVQKAGEGDTVRKLSPPGMLACPACWRWEKADRVEGGWVKATGGKETVYSGGVDRGDPWMRPPSELPTIDL